MALTTGRLLRRAVALALLAGATAACGTVAATSSSAHTGGDWVSFGNGKLSYRTDDSGDRVPDFSQVGYHAGDKEIPTVPVAQTLGPDGTGDQTARIQQALDAVAASGQPGAVLLTAGDYQIAGTIKVSGNGVVLRGAGVATNLVAAGRPHTLITVGGTGQRRRIGTSSSITDDYVPVGANTVHVDNASAIKVGDHVIVQRPQEQNWIHDIGMDHLPSRPDGTPSKPWTPDAGVLFDRTVTEVDGDAVTFDVPIPNALEKKYTHASVWKYRFDGRISEAGVESLSADGIAFTKDPNYEKGGYFQASLVTVDAAADSWVRDVTANRFASAFTVGDNALRVSVVNTKSLDDKAESVPAAISAQPVAYTISGQQTLISDCAVTGSNIHAWATQAHVAGPNVVTRCSAENTGKRILDAGPHQRWATGTLYDDITMDHTGGIELKDRQWMGSGQGWAGADSVLWNCAVGTFDVENPPTAHNWAIGCTGTQAPPASGHQAGEFQSSGTHVQPESLYAEQLAERHR
jgi:hypothetical protein